MGQLEELKWDLSLSFPDFDVHIMIIKTMSMLVGNITKVFREEWGIKSAVLLSKSLSLLVSFL